MEHAGFFVALKKGFYSEEGLDVTILDGSGAPTTARLVGNGTYKLGASSGSATVMARDKKIPVVSIAVINQHSPVVIYSLSNNQIQKPSDLPGKRIGVNVGGTKHREFQAFLKHMGISEDSIQLMGMTEASPAPLLSGQVDAMLGYTEDQPVTVELRGESVNRIALAEYGINLYSTNIIGNETYLNENPETVQRFIQASLKGWQYAVAHPEEAVQAYMAERPESDAAFNRANFKQLIPILSSEDTEQMGLGAQTEARWEHTRDVLLELGMVQRKVETSEIFTNKFLPKTQ